MAVSHVRMRVRVVRINLVTHRFLWEAPYKTPDY